MHDTSVQMIEKHYSTAIAQVSANIVRPVLLDIGAHYDENVVRFDGAGSVVR